MYAPSYNTEYSSNYQRGPQKVSSASWDQGPQLYFNAQQTQSQYPDGNYVGTSSGKMPPPPSYQDVRQGGFKPAPILPQTNTSVYPSHFHATRSTAVEPMSMTLRTTFYGETNLPESFEPVHSSEAWSYDSRWQGKASGEFTKDLSPYWKEWSPNSCSPSYINYSPQANMEKYKTQIP